MNASSGHAHIQASQKQGRVTFSKAFLAVYPCFRLAAVQPSRWEACSIEYGKYEFFTLQLPGQDIFGEHSLQFQPLLVQMPWLDLINALSISGLSTIESVLSLHIPNRSRLDVMGIRTAILRNLQSWAYSSILAVFTPKQSTKNKAPVTLPDQSCQASTARMEVPPATNDDAQKDNPRRPDNLPSENPVWPPKPLDDAMRGRIISDFCSNLEPQFVEEDGCAICAELVLKTELTCTDLVEMDTTCLVPADASALSRSRKLYRHEPNQADHLTGLDFPVYGTTDPRKALVCDACLRSVRAGKLPRKSLSNGLWIGQTPDVLKNLTWAEKILVARVRTSSFVVRIGGGMRKLKANVVAYDTPIPKVYRELPPPREHAKEVFSYICVGPCQPTDDDLKRTPLVVRLEDVWRALQFLAINSCVYSDVQLSESNLRTYRDNECPVVIQYTYKDSHTTAESEAQNFDPASEGVSDGPCPLIVHGLTSDDVAKYSWEELSAIAINHVKGGGRTLVVGHHNDPETIFNNPTLYPSMFPWLFPYGLGGFQNPCIVRKFSVEAHKKHLLLYADKRFQRDEIFCLVAFNHDQIRKSATSAHVLTRRSTFHEDAEKILRIQLPVVEEIAKKIAAGERFVPETQQEFDCQRLLKKLDCVAGSVPSSFTSKKNMRTEIWSMTYALGAPSWFITFAPADTKHPLCVYYAGSDTFFRPEWLSDDDLYRTTVSNPVACARFFHFMVKAFIKHVLGWEIERDGAYGPTAGFYGTVEQQGRLTLHLHLLLWIEGRLNPQEIRDRLMANDTPFQNAYIAHLESVSSGEFLGKNEEAARENLNEQEELPSYRNPTKGLPLNAPIDPHDPDRPCDANCDTSNCGEKFRRHFIDTVNDILIRTHVHDCEARGCLKKGDKFCKARFPREVVPESFVDPETGALILRKLEPNINNFTDVLTYVLGCNSDVSSLLSGTSIKAAIVYITDYITKFGFKTNVIWDVLASTLNRPNVAEYLAGNKDDTEKARYLITKLTNALSGRSETGAPMASMHLLGLPDHYVSHKFFTFYWRSFVKHALAPWTTVAGSAVLREKSDLSEPTYIMIPENETTVKAYSPVQDYIYRPAQFGHVNLYDWVCRAHKAQIYFEDAQPANESDVDDDADEGNHRPRKRMRKNIDKFSYFLSDHPQCETHVVRLNESKSNYLPNWLGGSPPRSDGGDVEYYFAVMLVILKPWRTAWDLKEREQSWAEAFEGHVFSLEQKRLMSYLNLKYECLDERDDFAAQRKRLMHVRPDYQANQDRDCDGACDSGSDVSDDDLPGERTARMPDFLDISERERRRAKKVGEINTILQRCDWTDTNEYYQPEPSARQDAAREDIPSHLSSAEWDKILSEKRTEAINARQATTSASNVIDTVAHPPERQGGTTDYNIVRQAGPEVLDDRVSANRPIAAQSASSQIDEVCLEFSLNREQERAFRLVANHRASRSSTPVRMYLGGMAGTGKSRVLKALQSLFAMWGIAGELLILAPTGSAAALIGGSTYHSALRINDPFGGKVSGIAALRTRLRKVRYIFLDEVSMVACRELYDISTRLGQITGKTSEPFGGLSFLTAGDFGQLPPPKGNSLYSGAVPLHSAKPSGQETAIGKGLWHQITTVIILRQNMRQTVASKNDDKLRQTLANMRYKHCDDEDVAYLWTLSLNPRNVSRIHQKEFKDVAIITGLNAQRDRINDLGSQRFASARGLKLESFFSVDSWPRSDKIRHVHRFPKNDAYQTDSGIEKSLQDCLWTLPPACSNHIAGTLKLCVGMPVQIKVNKATELCVTNGAEATVVSWSSSFSPEGKPILNTVFVRLSSPPNPVQLPHLPLNVVPITSDKTLIACELPCGDVIVIERLQVPLVANFAMTDFNAEGRTRTYNICELNSCRSHQAYYVALSRSASHDGTIILSGFSAKKIQGGASGWLRQEFRDLEILDKITELRYEGKLHPSVTGHRRYGLIVSFLAHYGEQILDAVLPTQLAVTGKAPFEPVDQNTKWEVLKRSSFKKSQRVNVDVKVTFQRDLARAMESNHITARPSARDNTLTTPAQTLHIPGLPWDGVNWSCAYDSCVTILYNLWTDSPSLFAEDVIGPSPLLSFLTSSFSDMGNPVTPDILVPIRDALRNRLASENRRMFPSGHRLCEIGDLLEKTFYSQRPVGFRRQRCLNRSCARLSDSDIDSPVLFSHLLPEQAHLGGTAGRAALGLDAIHGEPLSMCRRAHASCGHRATVYFRRASFLLLTVVDNQPVSLDRYVSVAESDNVAHSLQLRGVIYLANEHFTCRFLDRQGGVWFHDGRLANGFAVRESGQGIDLSRDPDGRTVACAWYVKST